MKIEKFKKITNGEYSLYLDNNTIINIHEDLILKYDLLLTKKLDDNLKDRLLLENNKYKAYNSALKYLNTKMRSTKEMKEYLKKSYDGKIIEEAINKLTKENYLNDSIYASSFVTDRINLSNDGPLKIEKELEKRGIKKEFIQESIHKFTLDLQEEKVEKLIKKQIKSNHNKSNIILKKKVLEYLINLGYDRNVIVNKLDIIDDYDDNNIREKEYNKLHDKLSKNYSGYELERIINKKMYEKGFRH